MPSIKDGKAKGEIRAILIVITLILITLRLQRHCSEVGISLTGRLRGCIASTESKKVMGNGKITARFNTIVSCKLLQDYSKITARIRIN